MTLKANAQQVFDKVSQACQAAGVPESSVKVIAVTKYVDSSITKELIDAGATDLGENRVDRFLEKKTQLKDEHVKWHFIGSLQRRKVKDVINEVDYFHALDSLKLAAEIQKRANRPIKCFIQVNISKEESKHGFQVEELELVLPELATYTNIELVGLMTMAPFDADPTTIKAIFDQTEALRQTIQHQGWANMPMTELSMGMSQDYPLAIAAGATYVRIGTAFFK
ncbi:YggS family pyridoxal phosphate-dependent enzyme [Streptococcus moroccensis]|uniref:Pyridoxal phosphate homeostasis protein n=1 Tax=Streptococcus moroccensis TaxID=1451356 RepID=A0ABT9YNC1_9STRE|nr:YggS family pyridoxal phosphate-dependent enzyme [Streptococcus moroccensis]MDQ0221488.1 pyridoxal phosphate enzyme (YggS family) [Streptococcus moroccensis]